MYFIDLAQVDNLVLQRQHQVLIQGARVSVTLLRYSCIYK
jgi:hypothetical protein